MATLASHITDLAIRIATECKAIRTLVNGNAANLSALTTVQKTSIVAAINELKSSIEQTGQSVIISDSTASSTQVWSSAKISAELLALKNSILGDGISTALDTLIEFSAAIGNDANFASTTTVSLGYRLRFDAAQSLTSTQKTQACSNLGIGEPDTDFVITFNSGLS